MSAARRDNILSGHRRCSRLGSESTHICSRTHATAATSSFRNSKSAIPGGEFHKNCEKYDFELADFQKYAITGIEKEEDVLITAHTGSGKTLPAEHAIQKYCEIPASLFDDSGPKRRRVIYTAPIKALSNQKFKDFTEKFPHISFGILTGDIKFNPDADCIIMTTEILRNTLFQRKSIEAETLDAENTSLHFENLRCFFLHEG